jgi:uncharacterized protein (TIGR03118 family)
MNAFRLLFPDSLPYHPWRKVRGALVPLVLSSLASGAAAQMVAVTNLVTDNQLVHPAQIADPDLVNPWGVSYLPGGPFWVSDNGKGKSTLYSVSPTTLATSKVGLTVTIPGAGSVTGQVANSTNNFNQNRFLFVSEDGTISGWRPALGTTAETLQTGLSANVYKGAALASVGANTFLYAANFRAGTIDVVKGDPTAPNLSGNFTDPNLPAGYSPFNVQNLGDKIYVAYALRNAANDEEIPGAGNGIVDEFNAEGHLLHRIATGGNLNAPWGLAIAPPSFGELAGDLLVGNFGDGQIHAFDLNTRTFSGTLTDQASHPITIDGLWALMPGNNGAAGSAQQIFFSAGPDEESHGLFGVLVAVPEPSTYVLMALGLGGLCLLRVRRQL